MKIYSVLKSFAQGLKNFEKGVEIALSDAEAKYHILSGRVRAFETNTVAITTTVLSEATTLKSALTPNTVVANAAVVTANTANVSTTANGDGA